MTPHTVRPSFLKFAYSPYLDRAALASARAIRERMAADMRAIAANQDCATENDLDLLGWTPQQIEAHARAARQLAHARSAREREPSRRQDVCDA